MRVLLCVLLGVSLAAAFSFPKPDPFAGSGCSCTTFCDGSCSMNSTGAANMTFYRMSMHGVYDMVNKNTGDIAGDTSFVISRATQALECRKNPRNFGCASVAQFMGDDPNSTDVVLKFTIEVDGKWGPYLECNPVNISKDLGPWGCRHGMSGGKYPPPPPPPGPPSNADCNCTRMYTTVGKQNLSSFGGHGHHHHSWPGHNSSGGGGGSSYRQGFWFSNPALGQCAEGEAVGGTAVGGAKGCTWRVTSLDTAINATCMYTHIDAAVVQHTPSCFSNCPQPKNVTSDCWLECYTTAVGNMTEIERTAPWKLAFNSADPASGGCPRIQAAQGVY